MIVLRERPVPARARRQAGTVQRQWAQARRAMATTAIVQCDGQQGSVACARRVCTQAGQRDSARVEAAEAGWVSIPGPTGALRDVCPSCAQREGVAR